MDIDLKEIKELFGRLNQRKREKLIRNLQRITFDFKINKSFLGYPHHPLTIPKKFYPFEEIGRVSVDKVDSIWGAPRSML